MGVSDCFLLFTSWETQGGRVCVGCYTQGLVLYPGLCGMCLLHALLEHPQAQSEAAVTMEMLQEIHSGDFSLLLSQSLLLQFYNSQPFRNH